MHIIPNAEMAIPRIRGSRKVILARQGTTGTIIRSAPAKLFQ